MPCSTIEVLPEVGEARKVLDYNNILLTALLRYLTALLEYYDHLLGVTLQLRVLCPCIFKLGEGLSPPTPIPIYLSTAQ